MAYTAESLFEYIQEISDQVDREYGSGYSTMEQRQAYYTNIYNTLEAREQEQETLWAAEDNVLNEALDIMEDENYHGESTAFVAYMYKMYGWQPSYGIEQEKQYAPYLYE